MGKHVLDVTVVRIEKSLYSSISLDSTHNEGRIAQSTLVFRYMWEVTVVEQFVTFMPNQSHKAQDVFNGLMKFLSDHDINISYCRGQSFDNAAGHRCTEMHRDDWRSKWDKLPVPTNICSHSQATRSHSMVRRSFRQIILLSTIFK